MHSVPHCLFWSLCKHFSIKLLHLLLVHQVAQSHSPMRIRAACICSITLLAALMSTNDVAAR
jgi:hypothetical protein